MNLKIIKSRNSSDKQRMQTDHDREYNTNVLYHSCVFTGSELMMNDNTEESDEEAICFSSW